MWYNTVMKRTLLLTLIAAFLFIVGCSKSDQGTGNASPVLSRRALAYDERSGSVRLEATQASNDTDSAAANFTNEERKLIKSANVSIRVENLAASDDSVTAMLKKFDAYAASTNIEENSRYYSLRVPAHYYDVFLAETGGMGRLINRYESTEDVTLRYYDLEGRLATKKELLKTFQSYLGKANSIEEILSVEARISELQFDIEGTGIQLRNLANRVDYATIDLRLIGPVTSAPNRGLTLGERIQGLLGGFGDFLSAVAMVIIGIVIYGIPVVLLLGLLYLLLFGRIGFAKKLWRLIKS
jgi:hypothetical protein